MKINSVCIVCGKKYTRITSPALLKISKPQYCSKLCQYKGFTGRKENKNKSIIVMNDYVEIECTHGIFTKIDIDEYDNYKNYNFRAVKGSRSGYYAMTYKNGKFYQLHRLIMNCPKRMQVDHINHDTLDNRKSNLRIVNQGQNTRHNRPHRTNKTGFKGVSLTKQNKYKAQIYYKGKQHWLGIFDNPISAAKKYDAVAKKVFGNFAYLNLDRGTK